MTFASFDGLHGTGKGVQFHALIDTAIYFGKSIGVAKRIHDTQLTSRYKELLVDGQEKNAREMLTIRVQTLNEQGETAEVQKVIAEGGVVLADRFNMSAYAKARALGVSQEDCIAALEKLQIVPDAYIIPEITVEDSIARSRKTANEMRQSKEHLCALQEAFAEFQDLYKDQAQFIVYNPSDHPEENHRFLRSALGLARYDVNYIPRGLQGLTKRLGLQSTMKGTKPKRSKSVA